MFSLRTLLLAVAVVAIGVVGLTTRNVWWASVMATLTWGAIAAAIIFAIVSRGQSRMFAAGFLACCGLYLWFHFGRPLDPFSRMLLTNQVVSASWRALDVPRPGELDEMDEDEDEFTSYFTVGTAAMRQYVDERRSFFVVAHCLWAWLFGFLGALLAGYLARNAVARNAETSSHPP